jgi:cell division protein FtsB
MGKYARVFLGCEEDEAIAEYITKTAKTATGFIKFCGDIKRLEQKAKDIAKWCLKHHFPWGSKKEEQTDNKGESEDIENKKAQKQAERLERIRTTVNELNKTREMPETIRGMAQAIAKAAKVSVETLYENKQLWHPEFTESRNSPNTDNFTPSPIAIAPPTEQAETQIERTVTEKALYKALAPSETPLRGQELPKFADVDFQVAKDLPKSPSKTSDPMWIETHGRLSPPKTESSKRAISQNPSPKTANADCLRPYEPPKSDPMSAIGSRIGYLKALLETPILRRSKSASEIASLQAELESLERDRQTNSSS